MVYFSTAEMTATLFHPLDSCSFVFFAMGYDARGQYTTADTSVSELQLA